MPEDNFLVFNLCNAPHTIEYRKNGHITIVDLPSNKFVQFWEILKRTIRSDINIFHLHGFISLGLIIGILLKKKIILKTTLSGSDDLFTLSRCRRGLLKLFLARRVKRNVVLSEALRQANKNFLSPSLITKIPNGIKLTEGVPVTEKGAPVFCSIGIVSERKATLDVVAYFLAHYAALSGSKLYLVGPNSLLDGIPEVDENYVNRCRELIVSSGYAEKIIMTGKLPRPELDTIYRTSLAQLFFSRNEGLPNVILESMAYNCVPIMLPLDGTATEIINNGFDGFILDDPSVVIPIEQIYAIAASGTVVQKARLFDIVNIASCYHALYEELSS